MSLFTRRSVIQHGAACLGLPLGFSALADDPKPTVVPKVDPYADAKFVDGPPPKIASGSFTVVVLPDTQNYCASHPDQYMAQTKWIVDQKAERNIACVLHLGDITNNNNAKQWEVAVKAMKQLDGHVPYFLSLGNHDYGTNGGCQTRATMFNDYFHVKDYRSLPTFGGTYDKEPERLENSFHRFEAGGRKFLVICLEFGPRTDVLRWANKVAEENADREAILVTHVYMYNDDTRYNWAAKATKQTWNPHSYGVAKATADDINDGEELWKKLVSKHGNFIMTLNGHVLGDGLGKLVSQTPDKRDVAQMLVNFQMKPKGGDGWLRLLEFKADGRAVEVSDYSPTRNQQNVSVQNHFTVAPSKVAKA
ncbi:metallophosphoesterase [Limnoglobus roseus]|uniref:Calcineurin-like phosphoesterase domain-containing protein n=1 Tax=Limnoglobus roseus TaxID=2598579 RepID=A0A5C1AH05_9BACT|nr:metallophosphoesterase [Limnoglobus roseus]QEL17915.1 hypothetical protein PX52LOC_04927 [Limnoglobus roseus]